MTSLSGCEPQASSRAYAEKLDDKDPLKDFRARFIIPTKPDLKSKVLSKTSLNGKNTSELSIYLCGNSLGLQPRQTASYISAHLSVWATKAVLGHFKKHEDTEIPGFLDIDDLAAKKMAPIVGAMESEVAIMETLTANLHFMMSSFYRPTKRKFKILMEGKAFPSDHYAVESQIQNQGFDPKDAMILIEPEASGTTISTVQILSTIDQHASSTALVLLPGIQYYTGQLLDIKTITAHAHSKGLLIGWDLAHAVGNVELHLHDWDVDFAAWCNYKYINAGPGAIAGLFVNERYGNVDRQALEQGQAAFRPRLSGWWGGDKSLRFVMGNHFVPIPGARGYQIGNPSALALIALLASLDIFAETNIKNIRTKSVTITGYLEQLLQTPSDVSNLYRIITPSNTEERGAQLSVLLESGLLDNVMEELENAGVVVDERRPNVIRVAPVPLYNTYADVWDFVQIFRTALKVAESKPLDHANDSVMNNDGKETNGWNDERTPGSA